MPGPGEYRPDPSEGITRIEDLPKPKIRRLGDRRVGELRLVGLPAHRQDLPRRHRQHQPQPLHSIRHRRPRRLPLPAAALQQLVAPSIHDLIPYHNASAWCGVRSVSRNHGSS